MRVKPLLLCALILAPELIFPQEGALADRPEGRITDVSVSGLKRTQPRVIEQPLQKFIGQRADDIDKDEVFAVVLKTGILEPLSVDITESDEGITLAVAVREKWAFFPIPFATIGLDRFSFGGAVMDANALGLNNKMVVAGVYSTDSWFVSAMYTDTTDAEGELGWTVMGFLSSQNREDTDRFEHVYRRFDTDTAGGSVRLSYPVTELLRTSVSVGYQNKILRNNGAALRPPESSVQAVSFSPAIGIQHTDWDGYFLSTQGLSGDYTFTLGIGSPSFQSISLGGEYEKSLVPGFRACIKSGILLSPWVPVFFESSPGSAGVDIMPRTYSAKNYAGASLGLEKHLKKFSFGTASVFGAYQALWSQGDILGSQFDHGVTGSLRLYMSRLAFPAVGLGAAYNIEAKLFQFAFSLGMSM